MSGVSEQVPTDDCKFIKIFSFQIMDHHNETKEHSEKKPVKKANFDLGWILWWQVDEKSAEFQTQVKAYKTLKPWESYREVSFILLILSGVLTTVLVLLSSEDPTAMYSFIDVAVLLVIGFFIYKGHRWAMIAAMVLWTYEKGFSLYSQLQDPTSAGSFVVTTLIWWTVYMHTFYLAYCVEQARRKSSKA